MKQLRYGFKTLPTNVGDTVRYHFTYKSLNPREERKEFVYCCRLSLIREHLMQSG